MKPIDKVHTSCKNCVFSIYDNQSQVGCHLNYISVFKNNNIDILPAYDDDKEFYIINKKQCIGYYTKESLKKYNLENASITEVINQYNKLNTLNYILILNTLNLSFAQITNFLTTLNTFSIKPKKIILIRYPDINNKLIYYDLEKVLNATQISWKIISSQDMNTPLETFIDTTMSIETKYRFVFCVSKIIDNIEEFVVRANQIVHNEMGQFFLLKDKEANILLFPATVYRYQKFVNDNLLINPTYHTIL